MGRSSLVPASIGLALFATPAARLAAADYETPPRLPVAEEVPAEMLAADAYRVLDPVVNDGFMNTYRLESDFGTFEVEGRALLHVRGREIEAMVELSELSKTEVFTDAVQSGLRSATVGQIDTVQAFAEHPVETIKGVPAGVSRMFKRYKAQAQELQEDAQERRAERREEEAAGGQVNGSEQGTGTVDEAVDAGQAYAKKYLGVSGAERRWAQKLGVDPYTSNEQLRRMIGTVAKVDAAGRFGVRLLPIPSIPGIGTLRDVNKLVWETDPHELKERNQRLLAACGVDETTAEAFFENLHLSPTVQTFVTNALQALDGVEDRGALVAKAAAVDSETSAWFVAQSAQLLAWYHRNRAPLARLLEHAPGAAGLTRGGRAVVMAATDHLVWTEDLEAAARRFGGLAGEAGAGEKELGLLGSISARAREGLRGQGYEVTADLAAELRQASP